MTLRLALVSAFPPGCKSLNEYGLHLATEIANRTDVSEVVVLADRLAEPPAELKLNPKIRVLRVWDFNSIYAGPKIVRQLSLEKVDGAIWNVQTATFGDREVPAALGLMTPALARILGTPSGVIAHNILAGIDLESTQLKGQRIRQAVIKVLGAIVTRAMLSASYTTVTLKSYQEYLQTHFPKKELHLVPHGSFDTEARDFESLETRKKRIVTMGKFGTYKKLDTLLEAFDILRRSPEFADYQLVIGGTDHPNAQGYLAETESSRELDAGVHFCGYVAEDDIPEFFGTARASIFDYSATTGSSGVLHQTACYGTIPVFPNIGDFVDVCRDEGLRGANYAPGDAADMARAIESSLRDVETANRLAVSNKIASMEWPFSDVVGFHIERLSNEFLRPDKSVRKPA